MFAGHTRHTAGAAAGTHSGYLLSPTSVFADTLRGMPTTISRRALAALLFATVFALGAAGWHLAAQPGPAHAQQTAAGSFATGLRYIGRDGATGLPAPVSERFIAAAEHTIERYGKDEGTAVPPPQAEGTGIATLSIARLGLRDIPVGRFGLDAYGRLDVPQDTRTIGWNPAYNALPGEGGATFFAAHFEYAGRPGVFNKLSTLVAGDLITVQLSDGAVYHYRVTSTVDYNLAAIDMGAILFGREGEESISLMTCSGPPGPDGYPMRTVVLAEGLAER